MHEFSIARNITHIAEDELRKVNANSVEKIELEIGELSGIEIDSLKFVWEAVIKDSVLDNAELIINSVEAQGFCTDCGQKFRIKQLFDACPVCGSYNSDVIRGKELKIKSLTVN